MENDKPVTLNALTFSDKKGKHIVTEGYMLTFTDSEDAEKHIQERYDHWRILLDKELTIAPSMDDTLTELEVKKVFRLTAAYFHLSYNDMMSKSRKPELVEGRRTAINICLGRKVQKSIIESATGIDHATQIHHKTKWDNYMEFDNGYINQFTEAEKYVLTKLT